MEDYDGVSPLPTTDKEVLQVLQPDLHLLYQIKRAQGESVPDAFQHTLESFVGLYEEMEDTN